MKNLLRGILVLSSLAGALALSAQTADEVVGKHLAAIGGKDVIAKVKSMSMQTSVQIMGNEAPSTTIVSDGVGFRTETEFNGAKIIQCYNEKGGWNVNPMTGASDPAPMSEDEYNSGKDQIHVGGQLYDYAARGSSIELLGKDAAGYKIKLTSKEKVESIYVIDPATYMIKSVSRKASVQGQQVDVVSNYSDYRKTELGYMMPYAFDVDFGGQFALSIMVKKVEFNKPIDPAIFVMPK